MGFKVTKDNIHNTREEYKPWDKTGKEYDCFCEFDDTPVEYSGGKHKFRLLDDDKNIYYYGVNDDDSCFCPLNWSMPLWGCTDIQYYDKNKKKYESL